MSPTVVINKDKYSKNFLQIGIDEWQAAYKDLKPASFAIYLLLASNGDGYSLELTQEYVQEKCGIKRSAYYTSINELLTKGYLVSTGTNKLEFNTNRTV